MQLHAVYKKPYFLQQVTQESVSGTTSHMHTSERVMGSYDKIIIIIVPKAIPEKIYRIARKFRGVKFSQKLIRLTFHDFIFADSDPIPIINIVSRIKIFAGRDKSAKTMKILPRETF